VISENTDENLAVPPEECSIQAADTTPVSIRYMHPYFYVKNVNQKHIGYIKTVPKAYWNNRYKNWVMPASEHTLHVLYHQMKVIKYEQYLVWNTNVKSLQTPPLCTLYTSPEHPNSILIQLTGNNVDVDFLKHFPHRYYDHDKKYWTIPYDEKLITRVIDHYISKSTKVVNRISERPLTTKSPSYKDLYTYLLQKSEENERPILSKYLSVLITQRYSQKTIREYFSKFDYFIKYVGPSKCEQLSEKEVNDFLYTISSTKVSESVIHSYINAIKFFYAKVIMLPNFKIEQIKRPRATSHLPKVMSIEQVDALLRATANIKHVTILYALYGHGIRLNELLNLKLSDILWDRNQIFIQSGKGKKDRILPMSQQFKEMLQIYIHEYKPIFWLFEGQDQKNQYSERSVQQVVKNAAMKAKINIKVSPHTLRHSYATHLVDGGTQLPFIKELLGHKDIKTTMIYTHVTTASVEKVVSPLDRLRDRR
jgi:site-specific recombinase XerD